MSMGVRAVDVTFVISGAADGVVVAVEVVVSVVFLIGALRHTTSMMEPLLSSTVSTVRHSYSSRVRM